MAFLIGIPGLAYSNDIVSDLVAHFPFNGNTLDASGNGNNGSGFSLFLTEDRNNVTDNAYNFGVEGGYLQLQDSDSLDVGTGDYTIAVWIKTASTNFHS